jgi:hypothetical protein
MDFAGDESRTAAGACEGDEILERPSENALCRDTE